VLQLTEAVAGPADQDPQRRGGPADVPRRPRGQPRRPRAGAGQHDQVGPGAEGQAGHLLGGQVGRQVVHQPVVFAQARRRHQRGQPVPFPRRGGGHRDAPRAPLRLVRPRGDEPLADGAGPVLDRDGELAGGPLLTDPAQRRRYDQLAQIRHRHAVGEPVQVVPCPGLVPGHDRRVQPVGLRRPVANPDFGPRRRAGGTALRQRPDVALADLVTARGLPRRKHSVAHPAVGGLVVHPEGVGGLPQLHDGSQVV
jgi:hypothetical protein